jgi:HAMP domain-containing protein
MTLRRLAQGRYKADPPKVMRTQISPVDGNKNSLNRLEHTQNKTNRLRQYIK